MKFQRYSVCSSKECIESGAFLFDENTQIDLHIGHKFKNAKLDQMNNKYEQIAEKKHQKHLKMIQTQIIESMEGLILKMFDKFTKVLTILKKQQFDKKSPQNFTYYEIESFLKGNNDAISQSVKKSFEIISLQYCKVFSRWKAEVEKLVDLIDHSIVTHSASTNVKQQHKEFQSRSQQQQKNQHNPEKNIKTKKITKLHKKAENLITKKIEKKEPQLEIQMKEKEPQLQVENKQKYQLPEIQQQTSKKQKQQSVSKYVSNIEDFSLTINRANDLQSIQANLLPKITKIIINSNEIKDYKINDLIKNIKNIRQITFNTSNPLNRYFFNKISFKAAKNLIKLHQVWDEASYFREKQCQIYFPTESFDELNQSKWHIEHPLWNKFKKIRNLWISNMQDFRNVQSSDNTYDDLQYLKMHPCNCCVKQTYNSDEILSQLGYKKLLNTLILRNLQLKNKLVDTLIGCWKCNPNLSVVIINFISIEQKLINNLNLMNLTNLCLKGDMKTKDIHQLNINPIFQLKHLKYLSLVNIKFGKKNNDSTQIYKKFGNFSELTYLNLYCSFPVFSQLFDFLHPNLDKSLTSLIIGETHIDSKCLLRLLNLDRSQIDIIQIFLINQYPNLKKISLYGCNAKNDVKNGVPRRISMVTDITLTIVSQNLKEIQYINVVDCSQTFQLDWTNMKNLKCICASKNTVKKKKELKINKITLYQV